MLLASKLYDPAAAVTKSTAALLAMTALDTTNLRLSGWAVPANGSVMVRLNGTIHGATTYPQILLGVLEGSTLRGRVSPRAVVGGVAAITTRQDVEALFVVSGLTPGATPAWDAAYAVESLVASTGLKYGGPNDTTADNAFGGFAFELYSV